MIDRYGAQITENDYTQIHKDIAKILIDSGCNVNDVDSEKRSPLMLAVAQVCDVMLIDSSIFSICHVIYV